MDVGQVLVLIIIIIIKTIIIILIIIIITHVLMWGRREVFVLMTSSTADIRTFLIFSLSSGQSLKHRLNRLKRHQLISNNNPIPTVWNGMGEVW